MTNSLSRTTSFITLEAAMLKNTARQMHSSSDFQLRSLTARSRRKRRPNKSTNIDDINSTPANYNATASILEKTSYQYSSTATYFGSLGRFSTALTYAALIVLTATCTSGTNSPCESNSWWDPVRDSCITCTACEGDMIPLRPCQLHRDTICGSIYDLKIDWVVLAKTEPNWKERRKSEEQNYNLEHQYTQEEVIQLDWQTAALFMAVLACLLFFIVAACMLIHHMRQWRRMERRLDQDVEELSAKLMAKLAEVQSLEGGTFFIGNADALRVSTTFQPQHVLLPEKSGKYHERRILKTLQPGNVYIEENSSKT